eukprot:gene8978-16619_t
MNTANMRNFQRKRFVSTPNDFGSGGGLHHAKQFSPAVAVDSTFTTSSPTFSRRGSEAVESSFGNGKESTLAALTVVSKANQRRRRRMSATAEQLQVEKAMMTSKEHKKYFHKDYPPMENFKKAVKLVQILIAICEFGYKKKEGDELNLAKYFTFTEYAAKEEAEQSRGGLSFDAKEFKANKEMRLTAEIKAILTKPPKERTNQQLAKVQFSLRSIQSFAEYPVRMQKKLVKVGWYEQHPAKRVILRQGHPPQAFYFVLSGSAVVKIIDRQQKIARTICFLKRGDSFGELAILHDTKRQSTVISRELIELLCISKEDFMDIFMASGGVKNINDPDHAEFISSLEFLKGWPTEELPKNPKKCLFNFFRRGAVLVRDSNYSDWIYVVKSGSCQVLKKLKKVKSQIDQNTKFTDIGSSSELSLERLHDLAVDMARKKRHNILDRHATAIQAVASAQSNSFLLETENLTTNKPRNITNSASYSKKSNLKFADEDTDSNDVNRRFTSIDSFRLSGPLRRRPSDQKLVQLKNNKDDIEINDRFSNDIGRRKKTASVDIPDGEVSLPAANGALSISSKRHKGSNFYMQTPSPSKNKRNLESPQQKLAIIDEAAKKHEETAQLTEADMDPCFVQVAVLQKGDVFVRLAFDILRQPTKSQFGMQLKYLRNSSYLIDELEKF